MTFDRSFQLLTSSARPLSQEEFDETMEVGQVRDLRTRDEYPNRRQAKLLVGVCMALGVVGWAASSTGWILGSRTVTTGSSPHEELIQEAFSVKKQCTDAKVGSDCYRDVQYAQDHIKAHPGWYVGLHPDDGFKAFQHFLHHQKVSGGKRRCPKPCDFHPRKEEKKRSKSSDEKCKDAEVGTNCYNHVTYTKKVNLPKHPEWYAGLSLKAGFFEIQSFLHEQDKDVCPTPCTKPTPKEKMGKPKKKKVHDECKKLNPLKRLLCEEKIKEKEKSENVEDCEDAQAGSRCFNDVLYALKTLKEGLHLEWYPGLPVNATRPMVQAYLHKQDDGDGSPRCPAPCDRKAVEQLDESKLKACHTATPESDKECYNAVCWVISTGIVKHTDWYPNISSADTFETVQARLALDPKGKCAGRNPCPCETAKKGGGCWNAVQWVMSRGIYDHPSWYPGLTNKSSFEEVQERLHTDRHTKCQLPCVFAPWWEKPNITD